jgi:chemotaxis protein methyltransferase CheR
VSLESARLERMRAVLGARLGHEYADDKLDFLAQVLRQRAATAGETGVDQYLDRISSCPNGSPELGALAEELTVTETFFLRSQDHFRVLTEVVVPEARRRGTRRLRLLSAGCASGEEPYSLAICLLESLDDLPRWDVEILGIDVNPAMLSKAQRAVYGNWSLRSTPDPIKARYFSQHQREFVLDPTVRRMVRFESRNLADDVPEFWNSLRCDAVFCRNVLMYFTPASMNRAVERLGAALLPGGFLFLGHAETLRGVSHGYHLCHTHDTFYYQKRHSTGAPFAAPAAEPSPAIDALPQLLEGSSSWVDVIDQSSARIHALANPKAHSRSVGARAGQPATREPSRPADFGVVLELMRQERFGDALTMLQALPAEQRDDADALLLFAVLLTNNGAHADAERTCRRLLEADELHAGAHYLMALCSEHAADRARAIDHDQTAIYLDPSFAMPHLHLGLLSKRGGDATVARRELGQAQILLAREEASRLVLFGGGFSREALIGLCRTELSHLDGGT